MKFKFLSYYVLAITILFNMAACGPTEEKTPPPESRGETLAPAKKEAKHEAATDFRNVFGELFLGKDGAANASILQTVGTAGSKFGHKLHLIVFSQKDQANEFVKIRIKELQVQSFPAFFLDNKQISDLTGLEKLLADTIKNKPVISYPSLFLTPKENNSVAVKFFNCCYGAIGMENGLVRLFVVEDGAKGKSMFRELLKETTPYAVAPGGCHYPENKTWTAPQGADLKNFRFILVVYDHTRAMHVAACSAADCTEISKPDEDDE